MESLKNTLFLLLGIGIIVWSFYAFLQKPAPERYQDPIENSQQTIEDRGYKTLKIGDQSVVVELAETDEERARGLSGRKSLESGHGMIFSFEEPGLYGFWMKEMLFSIDIIWIDADWKIVEVELDVAPETFPQIFAPKIPIKYVLELTSGEFEKLNVDIGSQLYLEERKY
jgi:uncharacterized membrane protein (UPF0127 family)